jgi:hypothetical protein
MISSSTDKGLTWFVIFFWAFLFLIMPLWPTSYWYELNEIRITSERTEKGRRIIEVDRSVNHNFSGEYKIDVQRRLASGKYTSIQTCVSKNRIDYRTDKDFPDPLTQEWWNFGDCEWTGLNPFFTPGVYRDCTTVTIYPVFFSKREVMTCSNDYRRNGNVTP